MQRQSRSSSSRWRLEQSQRYFLTCVWSSKPISSTLANRPWIDPSEPQRLIQKLSPDVEAGEGGKDVLVCRLCEFVPAAGAEQILRLRNLQLSAFPSSSRVWKALETWAVENNYPQDQDVEMLSVLENATASTAAVEEWRSAVLGGLVTAARSRKFFFPKAFWRWFQVRPAAAVALFRHVPTEAGIEERMAAAAPRELDETAAKTLATLALSRGWFRMHGVVLSATRNPLDAALGQIAVDSDPSYVEGLKLALRRAKPTEVVECALEIEDPRMSPLAAEAVVENRGLLARIDLTAMKAQAIWREALAIDPECWQGPADPAAAFRTILDRLLDGGEADPTLIDRLSYAPVADLGSYPRRTELWSRIGGIALANLLVATANGWLRRAASGGVPFAPEHDLQSLILENDALEPTLDALVPGRVGAAIRIVAALNRYDEQGFLRLIDTTMSCTTSLAAPDAEGIGHLVLERRWEHAATHLVGRYKSGRRDLRPALQACHDMLDIWERITLPLTAISEKEEWRAFEDLATELYPGGPDDDGLWERTGGNDADLSPGASGRMRWRKTMRKMRKGGRPTPSALLVMMMEDFPNNERLPHLAGDRMFGRAVPDDS